MSAPILATKLYIPPPRPNVVPRPQLIERLNQGLHQNQEGGRKLTLISAPAGFGKTTLISQWLAACQPPVAWLSLDEGDNDPTRFLTYLVAALRTLAHSGVEGVAADLGEGVLAALQSPQPPPPQSILTALVNEITTIPNDFVLVLDDYHVIEAKPVNEALSFLLQHLPPQMHLVIATRQDPPLPLARYRVRRQMTELRAADLRFTLAEAAAFLNQAMDLDLSPEDVAALESRTEGWIAGLQLAALALQGQGSWPDHQDATRFIHSFTGSHRFVLDYLVEEVLQQQPQSLQTFLLQTAVLDRMNGSLCDTLTGQDNSQQTLKYLEQANLFIVPLDDERRWYRYHHLFADLLRQRLGQHSDFSEQDVAELHRRASVWYEDNGLEIEAFRHAAAANDVERAQRLMEGDGMPLHFRGAMTPVLNWLTSLPKTVLDARPSLWVTYASALTMVGQPISTVEEKLQAAEAALPDAELDDEARDLVGRIAAIRAMLAIPQNQVESIIAQSHRALEYLHRDSLPFRTTATWTLGLAYQLQGDRAAARQAYSEAISVSHASGNIMVTIAATTCLGQVQEAETQLNLAAESYQRGLQLAGDPPWPAACEAYLGLARVHYQWNDLDAAQQHGQQSLQLARQLETVDTPAVCEVFLARLKLAQGDVAGAADLLAKAEQFMRQRNFVDRLPEVAAVRVLTLLRQGEVATAAHLAEAHDLPLSQARVHLAQGDPSAALAVLEPWRQQAEAKGWQDERLRVMVLQAVAHKARSEKKEAVQRLDEALALAQPGGFVRLFIDEGRPMAELLKEMMSSYARTGGGRKKYIHKLLAASGKQEDVPVPQPLVEPLSERELEVLRLIAQGLSNREIGERLFIALNTVKGHNRNIYGKLGVSRRTEAVARARELGLL